jgi:MoaA/NifB/PqqE/SkfB family radical SAM enzyme
MTPALFRRIVDSFPSLDHIKLQGMGEPLCNPHLFEIVACAKEKDIAVTIYTNGTLLTEENIRNLLSSKIDRLFISCDHYDPDTLTRLRPGLDFDRYCEGIQSLHIHAAEEGSATGIASWSLLNDSLRGNEKPFCTFLRDLGFRTYYFQSDITSWGERHVSDSPDHDSLSALRATLESFAVKEKISYEIINTNSFSEHSPCPWPFYHCYVTAEGLVQPCCIISDPEKFTFGSLLKTPFFRIWNSPKYFAFRRSIQSMNLYDFCR